MKKTIEDDNTGKIEDTFQVYDPDNLPTMRLFTCEIIRDLPELTEEEVSGHHDD